MKTLRIKSIDGDTSFQDKLLQVSPCVCDDWETIPSVIPSNKFVGYTKDCHAATNKQLNVMGYKESGGRYLIATAMYPKKREETYGFNYNRTEFIKGVNYIKSSLKKGIPVTVGIDDVDDRIKKENKHYVNPDQITDHFVVIVGMGSDSNGNYFHFFDNAVGARKEVLEIGTSIENRLYCDCEKSALIGKTDQNSSYGNGLIYTVSTIRESSKVLKK